MEVIIYFARSRLILLKAVEVIIYFVWSRPVSLKAVEDNLL